MDSSRRNSFANTIRRLSFALLALSAIASTPTTSTACSQDLHTSYLSRIPSYLAIIDSLTSGADVLYSSTFRVCGAPSEIDPYVQHGHPTTRGSMTFSIDSDFDLTFEIDLGTTREYFAAHAHFYNPDNGYENSDVGESTICWAGRRGATALKGSKWPGTNANSFDRFYRRWLERVVLDQGDGWWLNVHMQGGHFAADEDGHLIEWFGEFPSFGGTNSVRPECDAHQRRKLDNRRLVSDNACNRGSATRRDARNYYRDQMGVRWVDSDGNLTAEAIAHGYDLETDYLFFQFGDEGRSEGWGGPDGGIGGRLDGSEDARCDDWPVPGWGEPHHHVPEPNQMPMGLVALLTLLALRQRIERSRKGEGGRRYSMTNSSRNCDARRAAGDSIRRAQSWERIA
jgi:hypothetical protein